jgi:hypothetical protein
MPYAITVELFTTAYHTVARISGSENHIDGAIRLFDFEDSEKELEDFISSNLSQEGPVDVWRVFGIKEASMLQETYLHKDTLANISAASRRNTIVEKIKELESDAEMYVSILVKMESTQSSSFLSDKREVLAKISKNYEETKALGDVLENHPHVQFDPELSVLY